MQRDVCSILIIKDRHFSSFDAFGNRVKKNFLSGFKCFPITWTLNFSALQVELCEAIRVVFVATGAISFTLKQYQLIQVSNYVAAMCDLATMHLNSGALTF